jgi:acyl carrier protein
VAVFTIQDLQAIAREVIGDRDIVLTPDMTAADVPGWDSLNHTLIAMEIGAHLDREVDAEKLAQQPTFGALIDHINAG